MAKFIFRIRKYGFSFVFWSVSHFVAVFAHYFFGLQVSGANQSNLSVERDACRG